MNKNYSSRGRAQNTTSPFQQWDDIMKWKEWFEAARNEARWQDHEEKGLLKAEYVRDYMLRLWFEDDLDVSIYELDFRPLLVDENPGGVFSPLRDIERFRLVKADYALIWLNPDTGNYDDKAIDIAPECIRFFCEKYGRRLKVGRKSMAGESHVVKQEAVV